MRLRRVGDNHFVRAARVLEVIINSFFFHQSRGESKIRFAILHAVIAFLESALNLVNHLKAGENFLENIGHGDMLENPALNVLRQHPDGGHNRRVVIRKTRVAVALRKTIDDTVKRAGVSISLIDGGGHRLTENFLYVDGRGFKTLARFLAKQFDVNPKKLGKSFGDFHSFQKQKVFAQRRRNAQ
jgi:hypothetical protein